MDGRKRQGQEVRTRKQILTVIILTLISPWDQPTYKKYRLRLTL